MATGVYIAMIWTLTASGVLGYYYPFAMDLCTGAVHEGKIKETLQECPVPAFFYGPVTPTSMTKTPEVTELAKVENIDITWFLNTDGNPAINISFKALTPDSPQNYEVNVLADTYPTPIFCGRIHVPEPNSRQEMVVQELGMEMRCQGDRLKAGIGVQVVVQPCGLPTTEIPNTKEFQIPSCKDPLMYYSNECAEIRKKRIQFRLHQEGNSTVVVLATKTAYSEQEKGSQVYLGIRQRNENALDGWEANRAPIVLSWPARTARFDDLVIGKIYQVVVWRAGDYNRSSATITMKPDMKERRFSKGLMKKIVRRMVRES